MTWANWVGSEYNTLGIDSSLWFNNDCVTYHINESVESLIVRDSTYTAYRDGKTTDC